MTIKRNTNEYFIYYTEGKERKFYPDFIIDGKYYEIKGGYDSYTKEKVKYFPKDKMLILLDRNGI